MKKNTIDDFKFFLIINIVIASRKIALKYFSDEVNCELKDDNSPVTQADLEINQHLILAIKKIYQNIAIISEENNAQDNGEAILRDQVFIIDPIDGTSSFVKKSPEFTVNVALKEGDKIAMGIIYAPVKDVLYYAENNQLFKIENVSAVNAKITQIIPKKYIENKKIKAIVTRRDDELERIKKSLSKSRFDIDFISFSSSLKFCYLAEGEADIYYRDAKIKLWDVAAGFAIVAVAGFQIIDHNNTDLMHKFFNEEYIKDLKDGQFRIEPFVIKLPELNLF